MKFLIILAAHDGINSHLTGVGTIVNSFLERFDKIMNIGITLNSKDFDFCCVTPKLIKKSKDFNKEIYDVSDSLTKKYNGQVIEISVNGNGKSHKQNFGTHLNWEKISKNTAKYIKKISLNYDKIYVLAHDIAFSNIRFYCKELNNVHILWIPHSLSYNFKDNLVTSRKLIEKKIFKNNLVNPNDKIAYIGDNYKSILINNYNVPPEKLVSLKNGLNLKSKRYSLKYDCNTLFERNQIPCHKKLIFSWGRCCEQKGFDIIIKAFRKSFKNNNDYHLVLLMPSETSDKNYLNKIQALLKKCNNYTAIFKFNSSLPIAILRNKNTRCLIFASRFEACSVSIQEASLFSNPDVLIIYSNISSIKDEIKTDKRSIVLNRIKSNILSNLFNKRLLQNKKNIRTKDFDISKKVIQRYDIINCYQKSLYKFFNLKKLQ